MATKAISQLKISNSLTLSECKDGYWLYDYTRGMNVAMRAKTERDAFIEAITYYQKGTDEVERKFKSLNDSVQNFISSMSDED